MKNGLCDVCTGRRPPAKKSVFGSLTHLLAGNERSGLNRISHPDWLKLSVELNCAPNQNTNFPFHYRTKKRQNFHRRFVLRSLCVCANTVVFDSLSLSLSLSLSTHSYILANKRKRKEANYILIHQCCLSLLYNNNNIVKIGQNSEKSPNDPRRLAITQTPAKDYQLTVV